VSLTRLPDTTCTVCHATEKIAVTHFATGHPEFRALKDEADGKPYQRTIQFSHAQHMAPGLSLSPDPENDRAALRSFRIGRNPNGFGLVPIPAGLLQLTCSSCHKLESERTGHRIEGASSEPWESVRPPRPSGATFLPINFEAHCRSCHELGSAGESKPGLTGIGIPHRTQPAKVKKLIEAAAALELGLGNATPNEQPLPLVRQQPERAKVDESRLNALTASRMTIVSANCRKCHDMNGDAITPIRIPTVWFESARFDHTSHRGTDCKVCHPMPQIGSGKLDEREKINILGIASCRQCHAPAGGTREAPIGGIRHGCTDCHTYHNGGHGLEGRGAAGRVPAQPKPSAVEFLLGKPPPPREKP
jgi:hypothetical protein